MKGAFKTKKKAKKYLDDLGISLKIYPDDFPSDEDYIEMANHIKKIKKRKHGKIH